MGPVVVNAVLAAKSRPLAEPTPVEVVKVPLTVSDPPVAAVKLLVPEIVVPKPLADVPLKLPIPAPTLIVSAERTSPTAVLEPVPDIVRLPQFVPIESPLSDTVCDPLPAMSPVKVTACP